MQIRFNPAAVARSHFQGVHAKTVRASFPPLGLDTVHFGQTTAVEPRHQVLNEEEQMIFHFYHQLDQEQKVTFISKNLALLPPVLQVEICKGIIIPEAPKELKVALAKNLDDFQRGTMLNGLLRALIQPQQPRDVRLHAGKQAAVSTDPDLFVAAAKTYYDVEFRSDAKVSFFSPYYRPQSVTVDHIREVIDHMIFGKHLGSYIQQNRVWAAEELNYLLSEQPDEFLRYGLELISDSNFEVQEAVAKKIEFWGHITKGNETSQEAVNTLIQNLVDNTLSPKPSAKAREIALLNLKFLKDPAKRENIIGKLTPTESEAVMVSVADFMPELSRLSTQQHLVQLLTRDHYTRNALMKVVTKIPDKELRLQTIRMLAKLSIDTKPMVEAIVAEPHHPDYQLYLQILQTTEGEHAVYVLTQRALAEALAEVAVNKKPPEDEEGKWLLAIISTVGRSEAEIHAIEEQLRELRERARQIADTDEARYEQVKKGFIRDYAIKVLQQLMKNTAADSIARVTATKAILKNLDVKYDDTRQVYFAFLRTCLADQSPDIRKLIAEDLVKKRLNAEEELRCSEIVDRLLGDSNEQVVMSTLDNINALYPTAKTRHQVLWRTFQDESLSINLRSKALELRSKSIHKEYRQVAS